MFWYLILCVLFSVGCGLTLIEMYHTDKPLWKQICIFALVFAVCMLVWPVLLLIIDIAVLWNLILLYRSKKLADTPQVEVQEEPEHSAEHPIYYKK